MFSIFKKKTSGVTDINWLGVDIHSHLLPGIDDGCKDVAESVSFIKRLQDLGFEKLICTPHIFTELYPNSSETILPALKKVKDELVKQNVDIEIGAAAEYMIDEQFTIHPDLIALPGKHLLIEMSYLNEYPKIEQVIFDLQIKGYSIILAHPERYNFYHQNYKSYQRLKDHGCIFQLNLLAISGYYGKDVKRTAEYLLEHKLYDVAGTDLHSERHLGVLEKLVNSGKLFDLLGYYKFKNMELFN